MESTTFAALADPTRLGIVELLRERPLPVGAVADTLTIRQPQASKHLRVLRESGFVTVEPVARRRIYHLRAEPFAQIDRWVASFERAWELRLDALGSFLDALDASPAHREDRE